MITLKTLPRATEQEVFDQVATHLLRQGDKATDRTGYCVYRGSNNTACAAGCLIADDEYDEQMETHGWHSLVRRGRVPKEHEDFISKLQRIHDYKDTADWKLYLEGIAECHNLNTDCLNYMPNP